MEIKRPSQAQLESMDKPALIGLVNQLFEFIEQMKSEYEKTIRSLESRIVELEKQVSPKKTSQNSSIAPSSDLTRPGKHRGNKGRIGPPKGHKGESLKITDAPDLIAFVEIEKCPRTGEVVKSDSQCYKRHQIIDIEPIKPIVIELRRQITTGPDGKTIIAPHPKGLKKYKRYGPNLKTYISYLRFELNIPWPRIQTFLEDIVGKRIGVGTLQSIFFELRSDLEEEYDAIQSLLTTASTVGADETGLHLNGKKWWMHLFQTKDATLFKASSSRGHTVGQSVLGKDFKGILLTDFWGAYNERFYPKARFQKCVASHLIRDIEYAIACEKNIDDFAHNLKNVFLDAIYLKKYFLFETPEFCNEREEIENRLDDLLKDSRQPNTLEGKKLWKRLHKYRRHLFLFLYQDDLPYDNNASERDIRDFVICRKISGSYRTEAGIETIAIVKSVFSTMKKRGNKVIDRIENAFIDKIPQTG